MFADVDCVVGARTWRCSSCGLECIRLGIREFAEETRKSSRKVLDEDSGLYLGWFIGYLNTADTLHPAPKQKRFIHNGVILGEKPLYR